MKRLRHEPMRVLVRRKAVQEQWLRGVPVFEIADKLDKARSTIYSDLNAIMEIGREGVIGDRQEEWLWEEIAKLNRWEKEVNDAWERSKLDAEVRNAKLVKAPNEFAADGTVLPGAVRTESSKREEGQCGDVRYRGASVCLEALQTPGPRHFQSRTDGPRRQAALFDPGSDGRCADEGKGSAT